MRDWGWTTGTEERRRAIRATAGALPDAEDWKSWLAQVRGGGADERLRRPGALSTLFDSTILIAHLRDYLIVATAEEEGARLATLNVKYFPMLKGLRPPWPA